MVWAYLLTAGLALLVALLTKLFPPRDINALYGYRTPLAMKNQANWDYAQSLMPPFFFASAIMTVGFGSLHQYWFKQEDAATNALVFTGFILLAFLLPILWGQWKLKAFDQAESRSERGDRNKEGPSP